MRIIGKSFKDFNIAIYPALQTAISRVCKIFLATLHFFSQPISYITHRIITWIRCDTQCLEQTVVRSIPDVTKNLNFRLSQNSGGEQFQLASISNTGDIAIDPTAGALTSVQHQVLSHVGYIDALNATLIQETVTKYFLNQLPPEKYKRLSGKHMPVFELTDFPGLIFKVPSLQSAQEMLSNIERCQTLVKMHNLNHCMIPSAKIIPVSQDPNGVVIFVMEKVQGLSHSAAQEASEVVYENFQDSKTQAQWREFFRQAAQFIALSGYWDVDWSNILLMEQGFGFVDFETVKVKDTNCRTGLSRLRDLAPSEFFDMIGEIAQSHNIHLDPYLSKSSEDRKQQLELRSAVRKWHEKHGITQAKKIDTTSDLYQKLSPCEKEIVDNFNEEVVFRASDPYFQGNLIQQRSFHLQPYSGRSESYSSARIEFETALQQLQDKNLVCSWIIKECNFQPFLAGYTIFL